MDGVTGANPYTKPIASAVLSGSRDVIREPFTVNSSYRGP